MKTTILFALVLTLGLTAGVADAGFVLGTPEYSDLGSLGSGPSISTDGLSLYNYANQGEDTGYGKQDLWVTTRPTTHSNWGMPAKLGATVNSSSNDAAPNISANGLELFLFLPAQRLRWQRPLGNNAPNSRRSLE